MPLPRMCHQVLLYLLALGQTISALCKRYPNWNLCPFYICSLFSFYAALMTVKGRLLSSNELTNVIAYFRQLSLK